VRTTNSPEGRSARSLFERAPCGDPNDAACATVEHTWSGAVTRATHRFHKLQGETLSGGGTALYRVPPDPVEPFESVDEAFVIE
jgi:hypothetical protein